ncbi:MAG TPA: DNA-formamidopyrimidine glycosylase family protein [Candidatus Acidoferrum sp.]|jgi:endonuclease-8
MPEGDTIFRAARALHHALAGQEVKSFETVLPKLARVDYDSGLKGRTVEKVEAQGKWTMIYFSGDLILLTHMRMSGSWHIYKPGERWKRRMIHQRIVIGTDKYVAVAFDVPVAEFHNASTLQRHPCLRKLGPSVLAENFDETTILRNLRMHSGVEIGAALLNQNVLAGIGNVFKSEVCFGAGVNPLRLVETLTIQEMASLVATARKFMLANVTHATTEKTFTYETFRRTTGRRGPEDRLWVYGRRGQSCHRCETAIESRKQNPDARTTFWCPQCQPMVMVGQSRSAAG